MPRTIRVKRRSMWSRAMKLSGRITRSTDECEMSRSCQSAMFSSAAIALPRITRARPVDLLAADRIALVRHRRGALLALARTAPRSRRSRSSAGRGSRARTSRSDAADDAPASSSARHGDRAGSPATTTGAGRQVRAARRRLPRSPGSRWANVPTAPEILPTADPRRAPAARDPDRVGSSAYQSASLTPSVIGSAWTPWVRPIIGVRRCSSARDADRLRQASHVL